MGYAAKLGASLKPELKIVSIGSGDSIRSVTLSVSSKLPDIYTELTIDNFWFKNLRSLNTSVSTTGEAGAMTVTYNNTTGSLVCSGSYVTKNKAYRSSISYNVYAVYID